MRLPSRITAWIPVLIFCLTVTAAPPLSQDALLVLKNGRVIRINGEFQVEGPWVRFRTKKNGDLVSLPLRAVDLEASWKRTDVWRKQQAEKAKAKAQHKPERGLLKLERPNDPSADPLDGTTVKPPSLYRHPLLLPTFESSFGPKYAGSAFLVRLNANGPVLLVTAHGLLSQAAGFPRQLMWWELSKQIQGVSAYSARDGATLRADKVLPIDSAAPVTPQNASRDLAAFVLDNTRATAFALSTRPPQIGERIWLYADPVRDKILSGAILHQARITAVNDDIIEYRFLDTNLKLEGVRGAAVVNANGDVVAMHVAGGFMEGGWTGWGNPARAIRERLTHALSAKP